MNVYSGFLLAFLLAGSAEAAPEGARSYVKKTPDLALKAASVEYRSDLDLLVFEQKVEGSAGGTLPRPRGELDGAPVLGYVFPTTLKSEDVGFSPAEGVVALAVTSHPDFDDSPLWDENGDGDTRNDGLTWHTHWVVLVKDTRVPGGLSVKEFRKAEAVVLPPTAPDMPMFMDSPGYSLVTRGDTLRVLLPAQRVRNKTEFRFDAVTAYMEVASGKGGGHSHKDSKPMLGVYGVYSVLSGDLSLPYQVVRR
ncbi:MAG TPA: hypothetical protein VES20_02665 [Bryobacteraceae bacterium]|nr:hypothetical protein [Bryobacteraceae bacterium]